MAEHSVHVSGGLRDVIDEGAALRRALLKHGPAFRAHAERFAAVAGLQHGVDPADAEAVARFARAAARGEWPPGHTHAHADRCAPPFEVLALITQLGEPLDRVVEMWRAFPPESELATPPRVRGRPEHVLRKRVTDVLRRGGYNLREISDLLGVPIEKLRARRK